VPDATAATVITVLTSLFVVHGTPLVLKSDNGSAFGARGVQTLCGQFGVQQLFSPPHMPRYNGSIEGGIGSLTSRTEQAAARRGYPGSWTYDDAVVARLEANATARPRGEKGPCPEELWDARAPLTPAQRGTFRQTVTALRSQIEVTVESPKPTTEMEERALNRQAIRPAL